MAELADAKDLKSFVLKRREGSSPSPGTIGVCNITGCSSVGRARGLGPRGRKFESCRPDQNLQKNF
jgi:hypothetical protein